jgi:hypothetical protein
MASFSFAEPLESKHVKETSRKRWNEVEPLFFFFISVSHKE